MKRLILISVCAFLALGRYGLSTIINIPDDYATIQQGIDASNDGDTVLVQPGVYTEAINFDGHNIVVGSLLLMTHEVEFVQSTFITSGFNGSVVTFEQGENSESAIIGFSIVVGLSDLGGGIYCHNSSPTIVYNFIARNRAQEGAGIYCDNSNAIIRNNVIFADTALHGGGVSIKNGSAVNFTNNVVYGNSAFFDGGGIYGFTSQAYISNAIILENEAEMGRNIHLIDCDFDIEYSNIGYGMGNPFFRDTSTSDFHLMSVACGDSVDSPCIDAGDPAIIDSLLDCSWGLGAIRSDMGAYGGGDSATVGIDGLAIPIPGKLAILQNYPNPFNSSTSIRFTLPEPSNVVVEVYDILGRRVAVLFEGYRPAGSCLFGWDARIFSAGVYFYSVTANRSSATKMMILLK